MTGRGTRNRLTQAQRTMLAHAAEGRVTPYGERELRTAAILEERGLLKMAHGGAPLDRYEITTAGREALR